MNLYAIKHINPRRMNHNKREGYALNNESER